ncbi:hypothetical protein Tco_1202048 [Tanacetum coccineum]
MFEKEKLFGTNFNDWFCQLKLVLRVEEKLFVIEQPLLAAPTDSEAQVLVQRNAVNDAYNEVACLILGSELHALLIEYEKGLPKKAATPQVMVIQGGRIQKANKKSLNAKGKGKDKPVFIPKPKNSEPSTKST